MTVSINGTSGLVFNDASTQATAATGFGFKNRLINGDCRIDQRNAGAAVTADGSYPIDRFIVFNSTDGAYSGQQDSSAPTGFVNSLKMTTTTADASLGATQSVQVIQRIEGFNTSDLMWGTASAQPVTLSFWVRSSLTGTFGGSLRNSATNRSYPFNYTISVANTWEQKSVTVAGDTTGTWLTTNGVGIAVTFALGAGADRSGTAGAWNSNNNASATGAVSVIGTLSATWFVTGVQLEKGSTATSFDYRPYGTEFALCQRYYELQNLEYQLALYDSAETKFRWGRRTYAVVKRATPSSAIKSGTIYYAVPGSNGYSADSNANITYYSLTDSFAAAQTRASGRATPTGGNMYMIEGGIVAEFSAEL